MQSLEKFFLRDFNESNRYAANSSKWIKIYQSLPKNILEIIIVIGFLGIAFFFLKESKINNEFIVLGGIYTICVIKLMPSVNRILSSFQRIRYSMPVIDNIRKLIKRNTIDPKTGIFFLLKGIKSLVIVHYFLISKCF